MAAAKEKAASESEKRDPVLDSEENGPGPDAVQTADPKQAEEPKPEWNVSTHGPVPDGAEDFYEVVDA